MSERNKAIDKATQIKLAVFDVDGVLTDGKLIFTNKGEQKIFHAQDGLGMKMLMQSGCEVAIISSRSSDIVSKRMSDLGISHIYQDQNNKRETLLTIMNKLKLERSNVAYTGDDMIDIPAMKESGLAIAVANARTQVKQYADWTTECRGGEGAVREICELILMAQDKLEKSIDAYS